MVGSWLAGKGFEGVGNGAGCLMLVSAAYRGWLAGVLEWVLSDFFMLEPSSGFWQLFKVSTEVPRVKYCAESLRRLRHLVVPVPRGCVYTSSKCRDFGLESEEPDNEVLPRDFKPSCQLTYPRFLNFGAQLPRLGERVVSWNNFGVERTGRQPSSFFCSFITPKSKIIKLYVHVHVSRQIGTTKGSTDGKTRTILT